MTPPPAPPNDSNATSRPEIADASRPRILDTSPPEGTAARGEAKDSPPPETTETPEAVTTADVIVLGGGPAGIATALDVARRGLGVLVLEREERTGGMAGSFEIDGIRVDHGSHRLHPVTPAHVMARLTELLGEDLQVRPRNGRLRLLNRWVDFPIRPAGVARAMPPRWLAAVARDVALSPLRARGKLAPPTPDDQLCAPPSRSGLCARRAGSDTAKEAPSYAAALRVSLGPAVYDTLYAPYAEKLWGLPGEQIDAEQARVRVSADTVPKVALRVLRAQAKRARTVIGRHRSSAQHRTETAITGPTFLYPRHGFGQIVEALDGAARTAGADIRTGMQVTAIETPDSDSLDDETATPSLVTVRTADGAAWQARHLFSTLPIPLLARLSDPAPPSQVVEDARALRFRAMVLVYLTHRPHEELPRVRWSAYDAHYLPGAGTPITRISEPANYRDSADDPGDRTVVCAEIPCDMGDAIWSSSDKALRQVVTDAIAAFDLPPLECSAVHTRRLRAVYPIYEHGFSERLARLEAWADAVPGVTTLGRSGLFAHDNTHHAFVMAHEAAQCLRGDGSFDDAAWRRARGSFRKHVVED
ncbi:MAG: FAD-dependent oxidoreductase [Ornithinimicrobium sp.]